MNTTTDIDFDKAAKYRFWDRTGKVGLLFFGGIYFFSTFGPKNWPLLISSGILMMLFAVFIMYNDYRYEQLRKLKWKVIGLAATLLLALAMTLYSMRVYSYGLFG